VLATLFGERGRVFYQSELGRATGQPLTAVQRELKRLVDADLVRSETLAGRRVYRANDESAVYAEIASLVRKLRGPNTVIRDALSVRRGISTAFVFGSFAEGGADATSDVDVMVIGEDSPRAIRTALARAERDLSRSVNEHVITAREWRSRLARHDPFFSNVRKGPKLWVVGDERTLRQLEAPR
jgi:predicted nucleotidyltransferase